MTCPDCHSTHRQRMLQSFTVEHTVDQSAWEGEWCKRCNRRNCIGFLVSDSIWQAVTNGLWNVLCPICFDEIAESRGVEYQFLEVYTVTWSDWDLERDSVG